MLRPYLISDVATQDPRERARRARMARAVLPVSVARDDGEWTRDRRGDHCFRVRMNHDGTADPAVTRKALPIQPLARRRPFEFGEALIGGILVDVLDRRGLNLRHAGVIGIRL